MKQNKKFYIQLISCIIIFILLISEIIFCIHKCIKITSDKTINYKENGNINYKVFLKDNEFYEQDYLEENMVYVSNLIDKISIDFNYNFNALQKGNYNFSYYITSKLVIKDPVGDKVFFEKNYNLKEIEKSSEQSENYTDNILLDYNYYNNLSSSFKTKYGIDSESYLRVELKILKKSEEADLEESSEYIDIPLSERTIYMKITPMELQQKSKILETKGYKVNNLIYGLFIAIFLILLALNILMFKILYNKKSKYEYTLNKLLREYDRLIVETTVLPDFNLATVYELKEFKELLDVRDNLKLPILFCEIQNEEKAYFYINYEKDLYIYKVKGEKLK